MKPIKCGLLGLGVVGGGTVQVLHRNQADISRRAGRDIQVCRAAVRNLNRPDRVSLPHVALTDDATSIVNDPEIDIVVELMGGFEPARSLLLQAIANGKHIVTANKALIALHGAELFAAAQAQGVMIAYESAVAGGIPIVKAVREGLSGNRIEALAGIINGTSNFILTEMRDKGREFAEVLADAQALGYAEADPTFDVEGIDAAHKLTILAAIAFGIPLQFDKVYTEGISQITPLDVTYAEQLGYRIKHLGIARQTDAGIELRVHPTLIPDQALIAKVDGVMNAVLVQADAVGPTLYYGAGAGAEPTASAVIADLVDVARNLTAPQANRVPPLAFQPEQLIDTTVLSIEQVTTAYYLRMLVDDKPGVMAEITCILGELGISIEALLQKEPAAGESQATVIMLTHRVKEQQMAQAISRIEALSTTSGAVTRIRVEHLAH